RPGTPGSARRPAAAGAPWRRRGSSTSPAVLGRQPGQPISAAVTLYLTVARGGPSLSQPHIFGAVVGTGFIGPVHVEALRRLGRPMVAVVGSTPQRGRAVAEKLTLVRAYDSLEELLADPLISVVHLATPNRLHYLHCRQALAAGKHVLCEKPL